MVIDASLTEGVLHSEADEVEAFARQRPQEVFSLCREERKSH